MYILLTIPLMAFSSVVPADKPALQRSIFADGQGANPCYEQVTVGTS